MFKNNQFTDSKSKAFVLLFSLFFVLTGTCSLQKLIFAKIDTDVEITKQPKSSLALTDGEKDQKPCSFRNSTITANLDLNTNSTQLIVAVPLFFILLLDRLSIRFNKTLNDPLKNGYDVLTSSVPIYIKNRILII